MLTGNPLSVVLLPLIAVAVIALAWLWLSNRTQREPADSVAQFSRALSALAPTTTVERETAPTATSQAG